MDNEKTRIFAHVVRGGIGMLMRAVDEASDCTSILKSALGEVVPGFQGTYAKNFRSAKSISMAVPMKQALSQAGMLDRMIRALDSMREGKK